MIAEEMRDIVLLQLKSIAYADLLHSWVLAKKLIVIPSATTYTMTVMIKHHAGNEH